jgi:hypothetical protein
MKKGDLKKLAIITVQKAYRGGILKAELPALTI